MRRALFAIAIVATACDHYATSVSLPPPSDDVVIAWSAGGGWVKLTVTASGKAHYAFEPTGWGADPHAANRNDGTLTRDELATLANRLAAHHVCSFRRSGRLPVSEEHSNALTLRLPGLTCEVEMLSNDWNDGDPGAARLALDSVAARVKAEAPSADASSVK